tara:strand:+ start:78 stop:470 length:393 start_codon:yes stop_codon:yes gene_type:complete
MRLIELFFIFSFLTILINLIKINPREKMIINMFGALVLIFKFNDNVDTMVIDIFFYLCFLYVILNIYTTRYSSIRMNLMSSMMLKKKIMTENDLFINRMKRFNKKNKSIMSFNLFYITDKLVKIFRNLLI